MATIADGRPTILVAEKLGDAGIEMMQKVANVDCAYNLTPEQLCAKVSLCDALIVRSATKVTRAVFEAAKGRLKVVGRAGVGIDNVDLAAATEYGCLVVNAPTANTIAAAEHGIALLCSMARMVPQADRSMKDGKWERTKYVGVSMVDKTLAVMGFGKVGSEVARRARGLGLHVIAHDPYASQERAKALGVRLVSFDEACAEADFMSLHMPLLPSTRNMFNDEVFGKMKKGVRIINVARGEVLDEAALARALDAGKVAAAALDVFAVEPPAKDNSLVGRPNVICTPHLGASTEEAQEAVAVEIAEAVVGALNGELASTAVNAPMVPAEVLAELQPFVTLASGLGKSVVQLVSSGISQVEITYSTPRGDDLDTRLLRAMVIKGILETTTASAINLVNADLKAKTYGLVIAEKTVPSVGTTVLTNMRISIQGESKNFPGCKDGNEIVIEGTVKGKMPYITKIGRQDVEIGLSGPVILCRQRDQPGMIGAVGTLLAKENINISFMTVGREAPRGEAIMAIGTDELPAPEILKKIEGIQGISETAFLNLP